MSGKVLLANGIVSLKDSRPVRPEPSTVVVRDPAKESPVTATDVIIVANPSTQELRARLTGGVEAVEPALSPSSVSMVRVRGTGRGN